MSQGGGLPPLPPLTPPTPVQQGPLAAELQAQGRRAGLRAALLSKLGGGKKTQSAKSSKMGGE